MANAQVQNDGINGINSIKVPEVIEKQFVNDGSGGEGILKNKKIAIDGKYAYTKFEVDVPVAGE